MPVVLPPSVVAVTGASGFIGSHVVNELLQRGYTVRAVVRDASSSVKTAHLTELAREAGKENFLTIFSGNLLTPGSYELAFDGASAVIHTAAVVNFFPKDPWKDVVEPSLAGTTNVLDCIERVGSVSRLVHTSSVAAIQRYDRANTYVFSEKDEATWSTVARGDPYGYAKYMAEMMVHSRGKKSRGTFDYAVINPGVVWGPCLTKAHTKGSPVMVRQALLGNKQPDQWVVPVDVREVAYAHVEALVRSDAAGKRFLLVHSEEARFMSAHAGKMVESCAKYQVSTTAFHPSWQALLSWYGPALGTSGAAALLGLGFAGGSSALALPLALTAPALFLKYRGSEFERAVRCAEIYFDNTRSKEDLGVMYRPFSQTLSDTVASMARLGIRVKWKEGTPKSKL